MSRRGAVIAIVVTVVVIVAAAATTTAAVGAERQHSRGGACRGGGTVRGAWCCAVPCLEHGWVGVVVEKNRDPQPSEDRAGLRMGWFYFYCVFMSWRKNLLYLRLGGKKKNSLTAVDRLPCDRLLEPSAWSSAGDGRPRTTVTNATGPERRTSESGRRAADESASALLSRGIKN
jgi:hypothetical protein